jgi:AAA domain
MHACSIRVFDAAAGARPARRRARLFVPRFEKETADRTAGGTLRAAFPCLGCGQPGEMSRKRAAESDGELDQFFSQREGEKKERLMAGAISQLHLVNFMSHANFTAEFCSGVNFVVGANGSGKSAILAAICVAFGITGRKTNRTEDGVKGLVRTGTNSSTITLRLTNKGIDAFRAEEYGPEIVIERTISVTVRHPAPRLRARGRGRAASAAFHCFECRRS